MLTENRFATVSKILGFQLLIILLLGLGFYIAGSSKMALSPVLGGVAAFIPNLYFALRIASSMGQGAQKIVRSFYAGESGKLILTAMLFYLIFQIPHIQIIPLLTGYVATLSVFWFALLMRD